MAETNRLLNFDEEVVVPVRLAGRDFKITQQSRPVIERVLREADYIPDETPEGEENKRSLADLLFQHWDRSLPVFALILGCEDTDAPETAETIAFLAQNLKLPQAFKIHETWWEVNEIESFFVRGGRLTMSPRLVAALTGDLEREMEAEATPN